MLLADKPALSPFWFRECFIMSSPLGLKAMNLRDLLEALREVNDSVIHYHLFQSRLAIGTPEVEFPNDFALWAANSLQDAKLAEKLSSFDPFDYDNLGEVRQAIIDLLEEYLWDLPYIPWARPGLEFHLCEASTVVMRSDIRARTLQEFCNSLREVGPDSVYYHFYEARLRLEEKGVDDFSYWIETNFGLTDLVEAIRDIDSYFYNLKEIRSALLKLINPYLGVTCGKPK